NLDQLLIHIEFVVRHRFNADITALLLQGIKHIQSPLAFFPLNRICSVRNQLQLIQHKLRDDNFTFQETCFHNIDNPSIYNDTHIDKLLQRWMTAFSFLSARRLRKEVQHFAEFTEPEHKS